MIETITALLTTPPKILLLSMYVCIVFGVIFSRKRERLFATHRLYACALLAKPGPIFRMAVSETERLASQT